MKFILSLVLLFASLPLFGQAVAIRRTNDYSINLTNRPSTGTSNWLFMDNEGVHYTNVISPKAQVNIGDGLVSVGGRNLNTNIGVEVFGHLRINTNAQGTSRITLLPLSAAAPVNMWGIDNSSGAFRWIREDYNAVGTGGNGRQRMGLLDDGKIRMGNAIAGGQYILQVVPRANNSMPAFTGAGLNDLSFTSQGASTSPYVGYDVGDLVTFTVIIDATGTPDTFKWQKNAGGFTTGVAISGASQTLSDGITMTFTNTTGHTVNDQWILTVTNMQPLAVYSIDGSTRVLTALNNGNVGIGVSNPNTNTTERLVVAGNAKIDTNVYVGNITYSTNGVASYAVDAAVNIAASGWTNTFGKLAQVSFDGTGIFYTNLNNALTPVYTNAAAIIHDTIILQPGGAVRIDGTGVTGRAFPL